MVSGIGLSNADCSASSASMGTVRNRCNGSCGFMKVSIRKRSSEHVDRREGRG